MIFLTAGMAGQGTPWALAAALGVTLLFASAFDLETLRIPDAANLAVLALALLAGSFNNQLLAGCLTGLAVFLALTLIRFAFIRLRGKDGLGGGDIKLLSALAVWLGPERLAFALSLAAGLALIVTLSDRSGSPGRRIAFGPFIAAASWMVALWA